MSRGSLPRASLQVLGCSWWSPSHPTTRCPRRDHGCAAEPRQAERLLGLLLSAQLAGAAELLAGQHQRGGCQQPPLLPCVCHLCPYSLSLLPWQIRDLASELLVRYFPTAFPSSLTPALLQLAQDALSSPRVQEAEAGAVLMKTILQKYELRVGNGIAVPWQHQGLLGADHSQQWLGFELALQWWSWGGLGSAQHKLGRKLLYSQHQQHVPLPAGQMAAP